ncbi:MAG: tyrosine-type recombinase/integrase [Candidatus Entotheonellia bacterium]
MKGSRPLADREIMLVSQSFQGQHANRNRALFILGIKTGFRISELLSLRVSDVYRDGAILNSVAVQRRHMKGKAEGRTIKLHTDAKTALLVWVQELRCQRQARPDYPLFPSREGHHQPLSRIQAWVVLREAYQTCGLTGKLGTHCMRKSFAGRVYERLGRDLVKTQQAMGHRNIQSTASSLGFCQDETDAAILA